MIEFKDVEVKDKAWADELLRLSDYNGCEYSFGNNYMWSKVFDMKIARYKNFYLVKNKYGFMFPAGAGDICEIVGVLREYCSCNNTPLCFSSMSREVMEKLCRIYCEDIEVGTNRDFYDYVYCFETLSKLSGKKLHAKRNHLNRFYENNWEFEPITPDNIEEVADMHNRWCMEHNCYDDSEKLREAQAVIRGLESFFELGFVGGIIRVDGDIHAYTFGERLNSDTFVVHAEKAFTTVQGAYTAINHEFVNYACKGYTYINREEDMGLENLRKAKLSYCPAFVVEKYRVRFKEV
ncbi:MAG: phosphatidylglycerol lysyltransferase domain-containing protein [Oscillospiraceae bacterium]|nr:phosphatidylglycerol lysyltransferase domain-containing protein [Oscillospiraceae bacterium]